MNELNRVNKIQQSAIPHQQRWFPRFGVGLVNGLVVGLLLAKALQSPNYRVRFHYIRNKTPAIYRLHAIEQRPAAEVS